MNTKNVMTKYTLKKHPQEKTNFISDLFYCWTIPMFRQGFKKELTEEDVYHPLKRHKSTNVATKLEKAWNDQIAENLKPSLWKAIWKIFKWEIVQLVGLFFIKEFILKLSRPLALGKLMGYYLPNQTEMDKNEAFFYASIIIGTSFVEVVLEHLSIMSFQQLSVRVRIAVSSMIYQKTVRLSKNSLSETTAGHVVNLLSNDMQQLVFFWGSFNCVWGVPILTIIILVLLYYMAGITALVGFLFLIILAPLQVYMTKKAGSYRAKIALKSDDRLKTMSEIISGIQVIKVYAWEKPFIKIIDALRRKEMYLIKLSNYLDAITMSFAFFVDRTAIFLCILTYVLTGNSPNAQYVYVVCSFYDMLMVLVSFALPYSTSDILRAIVSVRRFEKFFNLEEVSPKIVSMKEIGLKIEKASARWSKETAQSTLSSVNFSATLGELVAIIGPVGSGKTSLLQLSLGELTPYDGIVKRKGRIAYANQEPWLFAGTIRQNILFGEAMNETKYREVIRVCALEEDISQFPYLDNTIVGERGILLSGGQKARIGLARAIYRDADIYLLDDPLSAVDASVGKHIFNNCIKRYLKNKCIVLVTHQIQFLTAVDKIYLITNGCVAVSGSYADLQNSKEDFIKLLDSPENYDCADEETKNENVEIQNNKEQDEEEETRKTGKVPINVYRTYIRTGGTYFSFVLMSVLFVLTEILATGADYYVTFWVNLEQKRSELIYLNETNSTSTYQAFFTQENCIYLYSGIIATLIICAMSRSLSFVKRCIKTSIKLHNKMFTGIINASMRFFYTNSSGRILNRFSKDIGVADDDLPDILMDIITHFLSIVGTVGAICIVSPWTVIPSFAVVLIMYLLRLLYLSTSRSIKRMESTNRSPIFTHLTESMKGITTIRACEAEALLQKEFDTYQDIHSSIFYMFMGSNRAFAIWLDIICVIYVLFVLIIALVNEKYGGNVGFLITQGMSLTGMFQWAMRRWSDLENQMTSVERIVEYINVKQEDELENKEPPGDWPSYGNIEFNSVYLQYSENDPYVLQNLNVSIKSKDKIGIVGRTGAGKSSLIAVLFRLTNFEGFIYIDKIDTKSISLSSLRSKLSIIPQEPILFSGSIRKNLDPFEQYSDSQVWNALQEVSLKKFVEELSLGLYSNLSEGGTNFSAGQKQLICLARALLRKNKILILDEATANVDPQTDELLQKTIRTNFADCTVLTIAHRLHTIMDSDKVIVMNDGRIAEFGHPYSLLQNNGVFHKLVTETGQTMAEYLTKIAQQNFLESYKLNSSGDKAKNS